MAADLSTIVEKYIQLRDRKATLKAAFETSTADIDAMLKKCEVYLLGQMVTQGVDSYKTGFGTAYKQIRTSATVADWDSLLGYVRKHDLWQLLDRRANKTAVQEFMDANQDVPPGINWRAEATVNIRRN